MQLHPATRAPVSAFCFAMVPPEAPQAVSIGPPKLGRLHFLAAFEPAAEPFKCLRAAASCHQGPCACLLLCYGTSRGPTSCFYWAAKIGPPSFFSGLRTCRRALQMPACSCILPPGPLCLPSALLWYLPRPHKLFLLGRQNWAAFIF